MPATLPQPVREVVDSLAKLPGLGRKSALRIAMCLLEWPDPLTRKLGGAIIALRDELGLCPNCGAVCANGDICDICKDPGREKQTLCIVPEWDALLTMETGGFYHGQYFVLGGITKPGSREGLHDQERLLARLDKGEVQEIVFALGSTLEADNATTWLAEIILKHHPGVAISRLAQGMPLGAEVKHMDQETLRQSMRYRQKL